MSLTLHAAEFFTRFNAEDFDKCGKLSYLNLLARLGPLVGFHTLSNSFHSIAYSFTRLGNSRLLA